MVWREGQSGIALENSSRSAGATGSPANFFQPRSLRPPVKTRAFGMTPRMRGRKFRLWHASLQFGGADECVRPYIISALGLVEELLAGRLSLGWRNSLLALRAILRKR